MKPRWLAGVWWKVVFRLLEPLQHLVAVFIGKDFEYFGYVHHIFKYNKLINK